MRIGELRRHYDQDELSRNDLDEDPMGQFRVWFREALEQKSGEPNAMVLATATREGHPSSRTVLLKELDDRGFLFYTNSESRKGQELAANPRASITFFWEALIRQVHICGVVEKLSDEESGKYFGSRPRDSQLAAWASRQDQVLEDRLELESAFEAAKEKYNGGDIPKPPYWAGYRVVPDEIEFWQGRPHRLHDRFRYLRSGEGWQIDRLAP